MHRPDGEDELKHNREEMKRLGMAIHAAFEKAAPLLRVAGEQLKMAAQNLRVGMQAFGHELNEAMEKWSEGVAMDQEPTPRSETTIVCTCPENAPDWPNEREHIQQKDCLCRGCGHPLDEGAHGGNVCT